MNQEPGQSGLLKRWRQKVTSALWGLRNHTGESAEHPPPYVALDNQPPDYTPFPSRIVEVDIVGKQRPVALINEAFVEAMKNGANGELLYRENFATLKANKAGLRRFREMLEAEKEQADDAMYELLGKPQHRGDYRAAQDKSFEVGKKLEQMQKDQREIRKNTSFVCREAALHLEDVMDHIRPLLQRAGILPLSRAPDEAQRIAPEFLHRYRLAHGNDGMSGDSDAALASAGVDASSRFQPLKDITARRKAAQVTRRMKRQDPEEQSDSEDERYQQDQRLQEETHRRRLAEIYSREPDQQVIGEIFKQRFSKTQERQSRTQRRRKINAELDEEGSVHTDDLHEDQLEDTVRGVLRFKKSDFVEDFETAQIRAQRTQQEAAEEERQDQEMERRAKLPVDEAAAEAHTRKLAIKQKYWDREDELKLAERDFDTRAELRTQEARVLQEQVEAGEADADDVVAFELQDYVNGQQLTRRLIEAEERFQAVRRECQEERVYIFGDDVSSIFPDISEDISGNTNGVADEARKQVLAPSIMSWQRELPDLVDSVMVDFEVRKPELDEWEAGSIRDYDSQSLKGVGNKRRRIDTVLGDIREMHDGAVDHWATTTGKRRLLFHSKDGTRVFSRARN